MVTAAIKLRHLLLGRKDKKNLDNILKSRDNTLLTKFCIVKALVFPVVLYGSEIWTTKKAKVKLLSCVRLFVTPRTIANQAPLSMGFSRQEYWSGVPLPSPRYADDITLMAESEEELKSLLTKVKKEIEKASLKLNIQKNRPWHLIP